LKQEIHRTTFKEHHNTKTKFSSLLQSDGPLNENVVQLGRRLGGGAMGEVHECEITINNSSPPLTISAAAKKIFPLSNPELYQLIPGSTEHQRVIDDFLEEARLLQRNNHPNIVLSFGYASLANGRPCTLLMERATTTLQSILWPQGPTGRLQALKAKDVYWYGLDILSGLNYLHSQQVIHRDIKPDNILMFEHGGTLIAKLGDLGLGRQMDRSYLREVGGAVFYMAPEGFSRNPLFRTVSDIYSFGIMLIEMSVGQSPDILERSNDHIREMMGPSIFCEMALGTVQGRWQDRWTAAVALERLRALCNAVYGQCSHCRGEGRAVWGWNGLV